MAELEKWLPSGALLIGDRWIDDTSAGRLPHTNPATGAVQLEFAVAGEAEIDDAVRTARSALAGWRRWNAADRRAVLFRLADLIEERSEELTALGCLENGTPISFAAYTCAGGPADWLRYYAGWVDKLEGRVAPTYPHNTLNYTRVEPHGVVGIITAFNAPMFFVGMKVAPALAAGNTVVLKPSELAPLTSLRFGELCLEAGLPPGVVNVVPGDGRAGAALAGHADVDKISFTGGGQTARAVLRAAAESLTPASLELGGKSACMIFADADLDAAIATAVQGGIGLCSGQACVLASRLLVQREVHDEVVEAVADLASALTVGDPTDPGTFMGPVINEFHRNRILDLVAKAVQEGAGKLLQGGNPLGGDLASGFYVEPTVLGDVDPSASIAQHEIFGPVLSVIPFDDEAEAIRIANATTYGLAGYVFTNDLRRAHRVAAEVDTGYVSVNTFSLLPPNAPFGGVKDSGFGREGGEEGIREMTRTKNVHILLD